MRQSDPQLSKLAVETWILTSLVGMEPELMCERERYHLDIVELTSVYGTGSETKLLEKGWTLFLSGVARGERWRPGVGLLVTHQFGTNINSVYSDE